MNFKNLALLALALILVVFVGYHLVLMAAYAIDLLFRIAIVVVPVVAILWLVWYLFKKVTTPKS
jgi:hypothetical protein